MNRKNIKKIGLVIYMFLAIFEPPILPVPFIYILGIYTIVFFVLKYKTIIPLSIPKKSGVLSLTKSFSIILFYLLFVNIIDVFFIEHANLTANRFRCINQLVVLTFIQFLEIWYIFLCSDELNYQLSDIFKILTIVGAMQGVCAFIAYNVPSIRRLFVRFGDQTLFNNAYFIERRGYGFSMTLIDTFGYGMGLIAGYILLQKWTDKKIGRIIALSLTLFAIFVNARTGIVIFGISVILKVLQGKNKFKQFLKLVIAVPSAYYVIYYLLPVILKRGVKSANITIKWVFTDLQELYTALIVGSSSNASLSNASFFSNFGNLPKNIFEFVFGSGHSIYDTTKVLGFRTDVGYINLWWEFGFMGLAIILLIMLTLMMKALRYADDIYIKSIVVLNIISYFIVQFKAILIGYNPGVFINYLVLFAVQYYYFSNIDLRIKKRKE